MLAQAVAKDLTRRGVKAVEVFGDARPGTEPSCMVPADFLRSVGFKTVRPHPRWPRLRMELRSAMTWKEDVEAALEQLLGSITPSAAVHGRRRGAPPSGTYPRSDRPQRRAQGALEKAAAG